MASSYIGLSRPFRFWSSPGDSTVRLEPPISTRPPRFATIGDRRRVDRCVTDIETDRRECGWRILTAVYDRYMHPIVLSRSSLVTTNNHF